MKIKASSLPDGFMYSAALVFACCVSFLAAGWRDLWFDEAMTVLFYSSRNTLAEIYKSYDMANNHIGYSMLLNLWQMVFPDSVFIWRFSSLIPAVAALLILYRKHWKECGGRAGWALILGCFALSPCFSIYATALRGYMWSFLAVVLVFESASAVLQSEENKWKYMVGFFLACIFCFIILPTNLFCACAALALAARDKWWKDKYFWLLAAIVPAAFLIIYYPLRKELLAVAQSGESWENHWFVFASVAIGFIISMFPVLAVCPFDKIKKSKLNWLNWGVIWIVPLVLVCSKYPPFPRNFLPMWPLWLLLAGRGLDFRLQNISPENGQRLLKVLFLVILVWCGGERYMAGILSPMVGGPRFHAATGQDDWFEPYYMQKDFAVAETVEYLSENHPGKTVYITFAADGFPFILYGGREKNYLLWNTQVSRLRPSSLIVTARDEGDKAIIDVMNRFELVNTPEKIHETSFHNIYSVR